MRPFRATAGGYVTTQILSVIGVLVGLTVLGLVIWALDVNSNQNGDIQTLVERTTALELANMTNTEEIENLKDRTTALELANMTNTEEIDTLKATVESLLNETMMQAQHIMELQMAVPSEGNCTCSLAMEVLTLPIPTEGDVWNRRQFMSYDAVSNNLLIVRAQRGGACFGAGDNCLHDAYEVDLGAATIALSPQIIPSEIMPDPPIVVNKNIEMMTSTGVAGEYFICERTTNGFSTISFPPGGGAPVHVAELGTVSFGCQRSWAFGNGKLYMEDDDVIREVNPADGTILNNFIDFTYVGSGIHGAFLSNFRHIAYNPVTDSWWITFVDQSTNTRLGRVNFEDRLIEISCIPTRDFIGPFQFDNMGRMWIMEGNGGNEPHSLRVLPKEPCLE